METMETQMKVYSHEAHQARYWHDQSKTENSKLLLQLNQLTSLNQNLRNKNDSLEQTFQQVHEDRNLL